MAFPALPARADIPPRPLVAYVQSWEDGPAAHGRDSGLVGLPAAIDVAILSFVRPDAVYSGGEDLRPTGLGYAYGRAVLAEAIAERKARVPGSLVLLAVGGATYTAWHALDAAAIARLVTAVGADGVDIDLELDNPACQSDGGARISCTGGYVWRSVIKALRAALPRPKVISLTGWSVAAYGEGPWAEARPTSQHTGELLALFRHPVSAEIDLVTIMAYNATAAYDPVEAYRAYRAAWAGPLSLGVLVPPDNGRQPDLTAAELTRLGQAIAADRKAGMMLYAFGIPPQPGQLSANDIVEQIDRERPPSAP
ncbi:glycosyl hydrolase family 18 protein [Rhodospirillum rubrum]|uniref:glycosyl hydrolase family 18 protein n=1 Tax=Rhodospirillum rubrum TaxID=1085 RepID=UPI0019045FF5|nr:glycosyl hydrolase family 18 protein [Rhodospirillum rubrum]